jgi:hypothetical protein
LRLKDEVEAKEIALEEARSGSQILKGDLEDARLEQTRLEDELALRREEIGRMNVQFRALQKADFDKQKLVENEVIPPHY